MVFAAPKALARRRANRAYRGMLSRRLFCPHLEKGEGPRLWLNGVSVGEVASARPLVEALEKKYPGSRLVISCTTGTGYQRASELYGARHDVIGYPLDFSFIAGRFLRKIKPDVVVMMELDLWPNFLMQCAEQKVPVLVVGGRLSESSTSGYEKIKPFLSSAFEAVHRFMGQDEEDARRALRIGFRPGQVCVGGNLKFDALETVRRPAAELGLPVDKDGQRLLVLASTHEPEEAMVFGALEKLPAEVLKTWGRIVVPRHPERCQGLERWLEKRGHRCRRYSDLKGAALWKASSGEILLVDVIGVLSRLYHLSDVVFVGGSLIPHGGQNMMEPAALGCAVCYGPHVQNFRQAAELLRKARGVMEIAGESGLSTSLTRLLGDAAWRDDLGRRGASAVAGQQGATQRALSEIEKMLGACQAIESAPRAS